MRPQQATRLKMWKDDYDYDDDKYENRALCAYFIFESVRYHIYLFRHPQVFYEVYIPEI